MSLREAAADVALHSLLCYPRSTNETGSVKRITGRFTKVARSVVLHLVEADSPVGRGGQESRRPRGARECFSCAGRCDGGEQQRLFVLFLPNFLYSRLIVASCIDLSNPQQDGAS